MGANKIFIIIGIVGLLAITFSNLVFKHDVVTTVVGIMVIVALISFRTKKSEIIIRIYGRQ
ncbi:hypothetical protein AZI98_05630 [Aeribacillus pallidus]|jgi:energy-converting hydrogenase Eha subunit G|uniref:Uncharacterized protein n=1 Tax=Aeribacillus pallidus TaxID=33936 RepID=A0A165YG95_9BACI|nr:hypothetical protein AZI98_05630 [Aeribacillus pallidus]